MAGRVVVIGSSGFIGGRICKEAAARGNKVLGLSRSATLPPYLVSHSPDDEGANVTFEKADAGQPTTYSDKLKGADAVFISVGAEPVPNYFYKGGKVEAIHINGTVCTQAIAAAKNAGVPKIVLVNATMPAWLNTMSSGYVTGKAIAEAAAQHYAGPKSKVVCLKPGVVFGTRYVGEAQVPLPLGWVMRPLRLAMGVPGVDSVIGFLRAQLPYVFDGLLEQPVAVDELARTALDAAADVTNSFEAIGPDDIVKKSHKQGLAKLARS